MGTGTSQVASAHTSRTMPAHSKNLILINVNYLPFSYFLINLLSYPKESSLAPRSFLWPQNWKCSTLQWLRNLYASSISKHSPSLLWPSCFFYCCYSVTKLCLTLVSSQTVARRALLPMNFSRQEYWSELPFPLTGDLFSPGTEPKSPALVGRYFTPKPPGKPSSLATKE